MDEAVKVAHVERHADRGVRWTEVRDWLKRESDYGRKPLTQILLVGERFDVIGVRR